MAFEGFREACKKALIMIPWATSLFGQMYARQTVPEMLTLRERNLEEAPFCIWILLKLISFQSRLFFCRRLFKWYLTSFSLKNRDDYRTSHMSSQKVVRNAHQAREELQGICGRGGGGAWGRSCFGSADTPRQPSRSDGSLATRRGTQATGKTP